MIQSRDPLPLGRKPGAPLFEGPFEQRLRRPYVMPGIAHVYVTPDGEYTTNERRPTRIVALASVKRYDVDMRDGHTQLSDKLPSAENIFFFPSTISVTWRVHDQVAIVRHGIADADYVVEQHLSTIMRQITSQVPPRDWAVAEARLNRHFAGGVVLPEGLTIIRVSVKLTIDEKLTNHITNKATAGGVIEVDDMNRAAVMRVLAQGEMGLLADHLAKNRDATGEVLDTLGQNHLRAAQERKELRDLMFENGQIQDIDLEAYRQHVLPPLPGYPAAGAPSQWSPLGTTGAAAFTAVPPPIGTPAPAIEGSGVVAWDPVTSDDTLDESL